MLQLKDASIFQREILILSDVNLDIKKGDFNYLIGKTGSGKSSLMKTLYGDLPLQKGLGSIVGFDLIKLKENEIPWQDIAFHVIAETLKLYYQDKKQGEFKTHYGDIIKQDDKTFKVNYF